MTLALFTLSALDLLGALHDHTTPSERSDYVDWIYRCQHPYGGFRGFTGTNFGDANRNVTNEHWDPANLAGTFFALSGLAVLGDNMERVKRRECLEWLAKLQMKDGSFGEGLGRNGQIEGDPDVRYCFLAAVTRWILKDGMQPDDTYDGGIGQAPYHEAHAGFTYSGMGALSLLGRLPLQNGTPAVSRSTVAADESFVQDVLYWLVYRQTTTFADDSQDSEIADDAPLNVHEAPLDIHQDSPATHGIPGGELEAPLNQHVTPIQPLVPSHDLPGRGTPLFYVLGASIENPPPMASHSASPEIDLGDLLWVGFNGRCNKIADTCYSWWAGGTLAMLKKTHLLSFNAIRRYLLEKTQHVVGGFGKLPGDPPDILHSYLGLAALAAMKEPGLRSIDPTLCISVSAREHLESLPWRQGSHTDPQDDQDEVQKKLACITLLGG
ncbi:hypothetical protein MMC11_008260 [Xylographa trunciseda]|nr:hypothetical protein [Xylographa trunciseda]